MPIIQVHLLEGRSVAQKRAMIAAVTDAVVGSLDVSPDSVRIIIDEMHPEHFALAGISAGEKPLKARKTNGAHAATANANGADERSTA
ncbi:MAG: tautomerase family protein [Panacagrimonas sp.]